MDRAALDLLRVPGPAWSRWATHGITVVAVASLVAASFVDGVIVALFALVLLGLTVQRLAGLPGAIQAATGAAFVLGAWAAALDWYEQISWLDVVAHTVANGLLALVVVTGMVRVGWLAAPGPGAAARAGLVVVTTSVGVALGVVWEIGEWFGHTYLDDTIQVGYGDTIGDLASGGLGALLAGLVLAGQLDGRGSLFAGG